ncbi:hypothetical protein NQ315_005536 [Exocentrus adspersus]|uniref:Uncharacterized protein n=1 Tax=Exocentrus adspersus TaxID=1586481 RepID=A0AAV8VTW0_9CUCU|nr:hypothetical protein NQ315_005536 [Exocentrus adspersus]
MMSAENSTTNYEVSRRVARIVLTTIKQLGKSRGVSLKKIHDYIKHAYPYTPSNIVKINNTLQKALTLGAVKKKKNRSVIKNIVNGQGVCLAYVLNTRKKARRAGKKKRRRKKGRGMRSKRWCSKSCDKWQCWPPTEPGFNATVDCPRVKGTLDNAKAYRYCDINGKWETKNSTNGTYEYSHYENCIIPQLQELARMCDEFGGDTCPQIGRITRCIEMVGLSFSLVSLLISLYIFFSYRVLKNNRTKIHKNLFIATLLQVIFRLIKYIDQSHSFLSRIYISEACIALLEYAKTAMFMWMFIEGLYLHNMITVTVFQEYTYIKVYCYVGWLVPALMTAVWLIIMIFNVSETTWEYYYFLNYYWILEGPRSTVIMVNLLFLLNIIRVLIVKLRESQTSEIEQVRKAVRATIFLLPLMGISHILFFYYKFNEAWKFAFWSYTAYFLGTFQGFFVAVLYCFLNGEVQAAIKNSIYLHMSQRNYDYVPCRNFTLISMLQDEATIANGESSKWMQCCKQNSQSPEEKEINIHELNHRRDTTVVTELTLVDTNSMKRDVIKETWSSKNAIEETDTSFIEERNNIE